MGNNKQQDKKEDEKQKAEEVLTDLEKRIKEYQERAEISYQKKEAKIRQKNSNDQEALKNKLERLAKKEEEKLKKIEKKLQKKDPKWRKQQKLEKKKEKRAKKAAKKKVKLKKKQVKKQQAKVKKLKKIEAKKHKNDYKYQFSQESAKVEKYIAEMEQKINQKIDEISVKEVSQLERLKERYDKMLNRGTENIRKSDPEWIAAEKARIEQEKADDKKRKEEQKVIRAEQRAAQKIKSKELREQAKEKAKKVKPKDLKEIRLASRGKKRNKKEKKPFKESFPEFLARFDYVMLFNGKTINLFVVASVLLLALLTVIGTGAFLWTQFGPVPAHKVVDRYLLAFSQQDEEMLHQYGAGEYSFIADKIMEQENFAPVKEIMESKIYDIDYKVLSNGTRVGEQMRIDVEITNYDLGLAMNDALEQYRKDNYLAYFSGKYTDADLEDSLVAILQEKLSKVEKNHTETIPVYLAKTDDKNWQIVNLGNSNPYLTKMLTGCVYLPLLDENGEILHIPYTDNKVWTEYTPSYQEFVEAMDNVLKPENAIRINAG